MKKILALTASLLVDHCSGSAPEEVSAACDTALTFLAHQGYPPATFRRFLRAVEREVHSRGGGITATLSTPQGDAGAACPRIVSALERKVGTTVKIFENAEPQLLGGAVLALKDDRLDASLRGALEHLSEHLRS